MTACADPMSGPLAGLRVIDLTQALAGPYATMLLCDLGADVVKVEPPHGDPIRDVGPYREDDGTRAFGGYFQSINRGKRSVAIDLKSEPGLRELFALVAKAEVLVENFTVGVMERLGAPYERLREINPRLVYASLRGFGDPRTGQSPYATWPAMDIVAQAMGGLMGITGPEGGPPTKAGPGVGDIFPGALLALGIAAAVLHARETGVGQYVDVAMYDAMLSLCERIVYQHSYRGAVPGPEGNKHPLLSPFDVVHAADGWIAIAAPTAARWERLCVRIGRPELARSDRFATNALRARHREELHAILAAWATCRTRTQILGVLGDVVPVGPVNTVADIFDDPHVHARDMVVALEHPGCRDPVLVAGQPIKFTRTPARVSRRAPQLDEHRDQLVGGPR
jgi:crotonobetainyl-CoA:carnitine CoA-transferase CaiB-like acyl-CoA transferase